MLCPFWIYRFISPVSISLLTWVMGRGKDLTGEQTDLPICGIDVLCHRKPQYIMFIYVLQACHNSLAF